MEPNHTIDIYIVEDNDLYRKSIEQHLTSKLNCNIYSFNSGESFLDATINNLDVLILDYFFRTNKDNHINGLTVLKEIKQRHPESIVIILSGQLDYSLINKFIKAGANDYVVKQKYAHTQIVSKIKQMIKTSKSKVSC
ncbi:MAG: response regulator [Bacteroidia bacterium]|nr:response regulator [Bacteroidia bacterium]